MWIWTNTHKHTQRETNKKSHRLNNYSKWEKNAVKKAGFSYFIFDNSTLIKWQVSWDQSNNRTQKKKTHIKQEHLFQISYLPCVHNMLPVFLLLLNKSMLDNILRKSRQHIRYIDWSIKKNLMNKKLHSFFTSLQK